MRLFSSSSLAAVLVSALLPTAHAFTCRDPDISGEAAGTCSATNGAPICCGDTIDASCYGSAANGDDNTATLQTNINCPTGACNGGLQLGEGVTLDTNGKNIECQGDAPALITVIGSNARITDSTGQGFYSNSDGTNPAAGCIVVDNTADNFRMDGDFRLNRCSVAIDIKGDNAAIDVSATSGGGPNNMAFVSFAEEAGIRISGNNNVVTGPGLMTGAGVGVTDSIGIHILGNENTVTGIVVGETPPVNSNDPFNQGILIDPGSSSGGNDNTVEGNLIIDCVSTGIEILGGAFGNEILGNAADCNESTCGDGVPETPSPLELVDRNNDCNDNTWTTNTVANADCINLGNECVLQDSEEPSASPSGAPSETPSSQPSSPPSYSPSGLPSYSPSAGPTAEPTSSPTNLPTGSPSAGPTAEPTSSPTNDVIDDILDCGFFNILCLVMTIVDFFVSLFSGSSPV